eukprot:scaffold90579_cov60-Phaeocystis_antarctica.AAC.1
MTAPNGRLVEARTIFGRGRRRRRRTCWLAPGRDDRRSGGAGRGLGGGARGLGGGGRGLSGGGDRVGGGAMSEHRLQPR